MRFLTSFRFYLFFTLTIIFISCSKKEDYVTDQVTDYMILEPGKYVTYRLDSLVFTSFGSQTETHRYLEKHVVDQQVTDNLGRPAWRVFTYLSDSTGTDPWTPNGSYLVTVLSDRLEISEDNLRVIKMHLPIREGYHWAGNTYLPDDPYGTQYDFSNDDDMKNWEFSYDYFESEWSYRDQTYSDVVTVEQQDDAVNAPVININTYGYLNRAVEKYSKSVGLVYRKFELWEYQPNQSGTPYKTGFGVTLWMVDHN